MINWDIIDKFQAANPTKEDKIKAIQNMTDEEFSELIDACPNIYAKISWTQHRRDGKNNKEI